MPMNHNNVVVIPPDKIHLLLQAAIAHHRSGRLAEAALLYGQLRKAAPRHFDAAHLGGTVALQQGRPLEAIPLLMQALRIDPRSAICEMRLGLAHLGAGKIPEAEKCLRQVLARQPDFHEAWDNLGMVLKSAGRLEEAIAAHRRSIEIQPRYAPGWYNLGLSHSWVGRSSAALACHERALTTDPSHPRARFGRAQALQQLHRIEEAIAGYDDQLTRFPDHHEARSSRLFALNYRDSHARETVFAEHAEYGERVEASARDRPTPAPKSLPTDSGPPERKLRVAFLSPDLRTHAVASFLEPLLAHLDRSQFDVFLYHDHFTVDATSERLKAGALIWRNFIGQPEAAVETQIRGDAPDVLIDLAGHTGQSRLPLFARRLAPVQIGYLGYPNTTGLAAMDFKFTDLLADPVGDADAFHTERLVRFAPTAWVFQPPAGGPEPSPLPCLTKPNVTFGSFNNFAKISDLTLSLWARILDEVPASRLVLKSLAGTDLSFFARLTRQGLDPARVDVLPSAASIYSHLEQYSKIDIALDTFPYHGTTTTCEALWMQRPVVTLAGNRHASRVGVSLLTAAGHPEWIASDEADYVKTAVSLASDPARLGETSRELRTALRQSPLFDYRAQAALFGAALRACWTERMTRVTSPLSTTPARAASPVAA